MDNYVNKFAAWTAICLTDHTLLGDNDTEDDIRNLCKESVKTCPFAASVCVYPKFVSFINTQIKKEINPFKPKIVCVINFPHGTDSYEKIMHDTKKAIEDGADEIDLVIDYKHILKNESEGLLKATKLTKDVKALLNDKILKVIIEVGELQKEDLIVKTTLAVLEGNADFVKTSTGKVKINATFDNVGFVIKGIKQFLNEHKEKTDKIGLKVAGGVTNLEDASRYILKARSFISALACHPNNFRFGSSSLVPKLREVIKQCPQH
ncbi:deoxyribose-phosphate aldolase, putative [Hepatocystis sp. ex Piliocolobus tephrosceles]|nr:deoxyribose-phosphate aldolase, putative [Hepatocystis sp. ex Piliocolobus tephrosceles]VWU51718.1 deoxyribose-phosphate aldolase, putative [Hepatocystis sp. ex Piliocolobus tephrosceles]